MARKSKTFFHLYLQFPALLLNNILQGCRRDLQALASGNACPTHLPHYCCFCRQKNCKQLKREREKSIGFGKQHLMKMKLNVLVCVAKRKDLVVYINPCLNSTSFAHCSGTFAFMTPANIGTLTMFF